MPLDPNTLVQFEMLRMMQAMRKKKDTDDSSEESGSEDDRTGKSKFRAIVRLRHRVRKNPLRIVVRYRRRCLRRLGIQTLPNGSLSSPFSHPMVSEKIRPSFGKMTGLWRTHHGISHILELLEARRVEEAAATCVQLLKSIHQAALDSGGWTLASTLLPWEDPLTREAFGGDEDEMIAAAAWSRGLRDLQAQVNRLTHNASP